MAQEKFSPPPPRHPPTPSPTPSLFPQKNENRGNSTKRKKVKIKSKSNKPLQPSPAETDTGGCVQVLARPSGSGKAIIQTYIQEKIKWPAEKRWWFITVPRLIPGDFGVLGVRRGTRNLALGTAGFWALLCCY